MRKKKKIKLLTHKPCICIADSEGEQGQEGC